MRYRLYSPRVARQYYHAHFLARHYHSLTGWLGYSLLGGIILPRRCPASRTTGISMKARYVFPGIVFIADIAVYLCGFAPLQSGGI